MTHPARLFSTLCAAAALSVAVLAEASLLSAPIARDLVHGLENRSMDAIAAADPDQPGRFVAALYLAGQLLVVSAQHPSVVAIEQRLQEGRYRDVYLDLQGTPTAQGKFFVQDAMADGLLNGAPGSGNVDVVYEDGARATRFNSDFRGQQLTAQEYDARLVDFDARYAHDLTLLNAVLVDATEH